MKRIGFISILCFLVMARNASAGALKDVAQANNDFYKAARALGPAATPQKLEQLRKQTFSGPLEALNQEHYQKFKLWQKSLNSVFGNLKGYVKGMLVGKPGSAVAPSAEEPVKRVPATYGKSFTTGEFAGSTGASVQNVQGGKREVPISAQPKVVDGIIMEK